MPPCGVFIGVCLSYPFVSPEKTAYVKAPIRRQGRFNLIYDVGFQLPHDVEEAENVE